VGLRILFRVDADEATGFGHAHRCCALADALIAHGAQIALLSETPAALRPFSALSRTAFGAHQADIIILDRPRADRLAELKALRAQAPQAAIVIIGGASPADAEADLIIRQTLNTAETRPAGVELLDGPAHLLVKASFAQGPARTIQRQAKRVLVCLGGGRTLALEPALASLARAFDAATQLPLPLEVHVFADEARLPASIGARFILHRGVNDLADAMRAADLALIGGGGLVIEAAAAQLPAIYLPVADHQKARIADAVALGLGRAGAEDPGAAVRALALDHGARADMASAGARVIDGRGAENCAKRLIDRFGGSS